MWIGIVLNLMPKSNADPDLDGHQNGKSGPDLDQQQNDSYPKHRINGVKFTSESLFFQCPQ
jgi:hypothetical protein